MGVAERLLLRYPVQEGDHPIRGVPTASCTLGSHQLPLLFALCEAGLILSSAHPREGFQPSLIPKPGSLLSTAADSPRSHHW